MIRVSEMVLPGHPDKFCDQAADAIVAACYAADPAGYCQVEMSCWSDQVYLTGGIATARPLAEALDEIVRRTGRELGYVAGNAIEADRYVIHSSVCDLRTDATQWTRHVNDQCISVGWAGYDEKVAFLPPEHYLAHVFREALTQSFATGRLVRQGPDGKLIVRLRENGADWVLEHVLVTVQQLDASCITGVAASLCAELCDAYAALQAHDRRWVAGWRDVDVLVNPNGPLVNGGSDGDNGQTGRKLAVDYYGPRVPIGGGALSGKDLSHIDRAAAYALRQAAIHAVRGGAKECQLTGVWAPNVGVPLDVIWQLDGRGPRLPDEWFAHGAIMERTDVRAVDRHLGRGRHFFDLALPWNEALSA